MRKIRKLYKNRKRLDDEDHYVWSNRRCIHCEILVVDTMEEVPDTIRTPIWHINSGSDICLLCRAESIVASKGLDPVKIFDPQVDTLMGRIFIIAKRKLESDQAIYKTEGFQPAVD